MAQLNPTSDHLKHHNPLKIHDFQNYIYFIPIIKSAFFLFSCLVVASGNKNGDRINILLKNMYVRGVLMFQVVTCRIKLCYII